MSALSALFLLAIHSPATGPTPVVTDLLCEYMKAPLSVETQTPRLSWITSTKEKGWKQTAYQILVATDPKLLEPGKADLWDSGKVTSDASVLIPYAGKSLNAKQACHWKVRVWDGTDKESSWSKPQTWEMGLLNPTDWGNSEWIGIDAKGNEAHPAPFLRKEFSVQGQVKRARLYASGLGYAELRLNGKKLGGASEREPGYTNFDKRVLYVTHDITTALKTGPNAIGAILGTGWYDVHDLATWRFEKAPWRGRPRLRLALTIDYTDGRTDTIASDPTWKATTGPILSDGVYSGEIYDARNEMPGWDTAGFNDQAWNPAALMPTPKGILAARPCPPIAATETFKAKQIVEPKPGVYVVDFGQNIAGHVRLKVKGPAGTRITLNYSEQIHSDGSVSRSQNMIYMNKTTPPQLFQTETYICSGRGTEQWEPIFSESGFRYVEVLGFPGKPTLASFEACLCNTAMESAGEFECSNELLNKIQKATRYSYLGNAQSIPTDCPQREKNGWTADAHLAAEQGLMNYQSAAFYTKWINDIADDQAENGGFSLIIPTGEWGSAANHPVWDSAMLILGDHMYQYGADAHVLANNYDHLRRYFDFLYAQAKDGVITFDSMGDWMPWSSETSNHLTSTAYLHEDARIVALAAKLNGDDANAKKYGDIATEIKEAFNRHFLLPAEIEKSSQTALSLPLAFGLVDGEKKQACIAALVKDVERQGHIDAGILGAKYVLRALSEEGRTDLAYKIATYTKQPGWGYWIGQDATTLWENWQGDMSLNHILFGDISNWFYQWIAGIGLDPQNPGFKHVLIRPQPVGDLTWAKASHDGPYGKIVSSWRRDGERFELDIEIPANTSATVRVPGNCSSPHGARLVGSETGYTVFEVGSGAYRFVSQLAK